MATTSDNVHVLDDSNFDSVIANATGPVLVDFWAEWCQPCRMLGPTIDAVADAHANENVIVAKVDIDSATDLAARLGIASIPTVLVFRGGEVADRIVGLQPQDRYEAALAD